MQYAKILLSVLLCLYIKQVTAQDSLATVNGLVKDAIGVPISDVSVFVKNKKMGTVTSPDGTFSLVGLPNGSYTIVVSGIGFKTVERKITVKGNADLSIEFGLESDDKTMETVSVIGRSATQLANRQSYNVVAIDARQLHNTTLDLSHTLDRVSGVRVRESGGVGSSFNFSLNGFSGNQVRFFLDGVPMDNFGSSFQINNIPINFAERVEVYKGVVPIWLGSDALGGAVNIITGNKYKNYLDVSYSYGSFNTHKTSINAGHTTNKGFTVQLSAFQNYSDNNYKVTLDVGDINTGAYSLNTTVRRFHDTYHNETLVGNIGFVNKKWADRFLIGMTLGQNYKEIQTGARMEAVFGAWHRKGTTVMPTLKYQKRDLFVKGLDVIVNANYNLGSEQNIDTLFRRYDWYGRYKEYQGPGGERSRTMYKFKNNIGLATATLSYKISEQHSVAVNNVYSTFDRKGSDVLFPMEARYQHPQKTNKNVLGLSYKFDPNEKVSIMTFAKYLSQLSRTMTSYNPSGNWGDVAYMEQSNNLNKLGYGVAGSYFFQTNFQLKASFERSNRLPENHELFGDLINSASNFNLRPERSDNINLGAIYSFKVADNHRMGLNVGAIYRNATDFIYFRFGQNQTMVIPDNRDGVKTTGAEGELRYSYKTWFTAGFNLTYQRIINLQKYEPNITSISIVYKDRMPNIPYLFGNADASIFLRDVWRKGDALNIGYNMLYVHEFYLYWPSQGGRDGKNNIRQQIAHDVNIIYTLKNGRYNLGLECKNLTDALLYDNFSLQKPARAVYAKLRYFIGQ